MKSIIRRIARKVGRSIDHDLLTSLERIKHHDYTNPSHQDDSKVSQIHLALYYKDLMTRNATLPSFNEVGFRCYSQFEEDGILLFIFSLIGVKTKKVVELCAGEGRECMATNLIINHGWNGFLFDGDSSNVDKGMNFFASHKDTFLWPPRFEQAWITAENVNKILESVGLEGEVDLLSLDIDGMDYWVWKALDRIRPRVVVCETHNVIPENLAITVPYDPNFVLAIPDYHSASLAAMAKLSAEKGYRLVGSHRHGFNAFFVRDDIGADILPTVSVESCVQDPYSKNARLNRWPKVKHMEWIHV